MTARMGKDGKQRFTFQEDELAQLKKALNGSKNGWVYKTISAVIVFLVTTCLLGAAWAGIIKVPALEVRQANTEQIMSDLRLDVNSLILTNIALKTKVEIFLDGQGKR